MYVYLVLVQKGSCICNNSIKFSNQLTDYLTLYIYLTFHAHATLVCGINFQHQFINYMQRILIKLITLNHMIKSEVYLRNYLSLFYLC